MGVEEMKQLIMKHILAMAVAMVVWLSGPAVLANGENEPGATEAVVLAAAPADPADIELVVVAAAAASVGAPVAAPAVHWVVQPAAAPAQGPRDQNMDMDGPDDGWGIHSDVMGHSCFTPMEQFVPKAETGVCMCCPKIGAGVIKCTRGYSETMTCMAMGNPCAVFTFCCCALPMAPALPLVDTARVAAGDRSVRKRAAAGCAAEACLVGGTVAFCLLCP
jgi:hypothetical protein